MPSVCLYALGAAIVAALVTNLLVPPIARLAVALGAFDEPDSRKLQPEAKPRLGGIAIIAGLVSAAGAVAVTQWGAWGGSIRRGELLALLCGGALVFLVGVVDDLSGVSTAKKFLIELVAAGLLVWAGWSFHVLRLPLVGAIDLGVFAGPVSVLWIVGVTNAINLIDGLDGLAGGVVAIIATSMLGYAALQANPGTVVLMAATAGACLGFLRHNWEPARIYMGDSGALTLGFLLAAMTVHSAIKAPAAVAILVPILALGVPVIDTLLVMAVRFLNQEHSRLATRFLGMFSADRNHLHHLLTTLGGNRSRIVGVIYGLVGAFCAMALVVAVTGQSSLGVVLLIVEFLVVLGMRRMGLAMQVRRLARQRREEVKSEVLGLAEPAAAPTMARVRSFRR